MDDTRIRAIFDRMREIERKWQGIQERVSRVRKGSGKFQQVLDEEIKSGSSGPIDRNKKGAVSDLRKTAEEIALKNGVDPALVKAMIQTESSWRPDAVSDKGAKGLMQLMDITAREVGVKDPLDPEQNIEGGVRYIKKLLEKYDGNLPEALAAYNYGLNRVPKGKGVPSIPPVQNYVMTVLNRIDEES